jgi:hypothetical protein
VEKLPSGADAARLLESDVQHGYIKAAFCLKSDTLRSGTASDKRSWCGRRFGTGNDSL